MKSGERNNYNIPATSAFRLTANELGTGQVWYFAPGKQDERGPTITPNAVVTLGPFADICFFRLECFEGEITVEPARNGAPTPVRLSTMINIGRRGTLIAAVGTSLEAWSTRDGQPPSTIPFRSFFNQGWLTPLRVFSRQRLNLPMEYNLAVAGMQWNSPIDGIMFQIDRVLALNPRPDYCIVGGATNDVSFNRSINDIWNDWLAGIRKLQAADIIPAVCTTLPRGSAQLNAAQQGVVMQLNNRIREFCYGRRDILLIDPWPYMVDQASASSNALAGMMKADNIHTATIGATVIAQCALKAFDSVIDVFGTEYLAAADIFHATNNPGGNLLYSGTTNLGLMTGITGVKTANAGLTHTGDVATGFSAVRGTATSTCAWDHSKVARSDVPSGEWQAGKITALNGGGADEIYNIRASANMADVNLNGNDWVYGEMAFEITEAPIRITSFEGYLLQSRSQFTYSSTDWGFETGAGGRFLLSETCKGVLRTAPMKIEPNAIAPLNFGLRVRLDASAGDASIAYRIGNLQMRKVI